MSKETSLCNTICLIVKFLWHHFIEIFQLLVFQNFCMKFCNTIYRESCDDCHVSHTHLTIPENCHLTYFFFISRIFCSYFIYKTTIDLLHNLVNTWKQFREEVDWPFFQCFCHNCMVCVSTCLSCNIPCLFPCQTFLVDEQMHQFRYCNCWMCIIHLNNNFFVKFANITICSLIFCNQLLQACRNEEILLF